MRESPRNVSQKHPQLSSERSVPLPVDAEDGDLDSSLAMIPRAPHPMDVVYSKEGCNKRFLMKYYVQILANLLTTNLQNNYFVSIFIPMSVDSEPVLSALMAWSSMHLSRFDPSFTVPALEYKSSALNAVASALSPLSTKLKNAESMEFTLAAALILCSLEVCFGDTSRWFDHLLGARFIIQSAKSLGPNGKVFRGTEHFMRTIDGQWLLSHFAYHDVLGSVALDQPPLLHGAYWLKEEEVVDPYLGVGSQILVLISEISSLPRPSTEAIEWVGSDEGSASPEPSDITGWLQLITSIRTEENSFATRALEIEKCLQDWRPPLTVNSSLQALANSYKTSGLIYLYRKIRTFAPATTYVANQQIAKYVDETISHMRKIPLSSLPECATPFPLFMAGAETMDPDHTRYVRERLDSQLTHRGFGNVQSIMDVLDELWRLKSSNQKGPTGEMIDWRDIVTAKGWRLPLM